MHSKPLFHRHPQLLELYGVIGKPLAHSLSADYFTHKFASEGELHMREYRKMELESIEELQALLSSHPNLRGLNVTHPYKEQIIPLLTRLSEAAERIGAVNCVCIEPDGTTTGYNTDYEGFTMALSDFLLNERPQALVLGTGGASKAVQAALADKGIGFLTVSHSGKGELSYEELTSEIVESHKLIINATPLGMHPNEAECPPFPYELLTSEHYLFDLIYNPATTEFLRRGQLKDARICNGQKMFVYQAEASWRHFGNRH